MLYKREFKSATLCCLRYMALVASRNTTVTFQLKCLDFQSYQYQKLVPVLSSFAMGYEVDYFRSDFRTAYFFVMLNLLNDSSSYHKVLHIK